MPATWNVTTAWKRGSRTVTPGAEVSIKGQRGRFRFRHHVITTGGAEWIDVVSPVGGFRSFRPDQVRVVHRQRKLRPTVGRAARVATLAVA